MGCPLTAIVIPAKAGTQRRARARSCRERHTLVRHPRAWPEDRTPEGPLGL